MALAHGADSNQKKKKKKNKPLSYAVERASLSIVNLLIDHGGDVTMGQLWTTQ